MSWLLGRSSIPPGLGKYLKDSWVLSSLEWREENKTEVDLAVVVTVQTTCLSFLNAWSWVRSEEIYIDIFVYTREGNKYVWNASKYTFT